MLDFVREVIDGAEASDAVVSRESAISALRPLGLDQFGSFLLSMPNPAYPKLTKLLPAMASDEVQRNWTGSSGHALLAQSVGFVRTVSYNFAQHCQRGLDGAKVLDFGCGYGRLIRLMYALTDSRNVYGVDPWPKSIDICQADGLSENLFVSEYLPRDLPVGDIRFDLIYAFSVFTHLSERATLSALRVLRNYVKTDGILCITIRPMEYWVHDPHTSPQEKELQMQRHRDVGFSFKPHDRAPIDGDITYGDTSLSLDWLNEHMPEWRIVGTDYLTVDPFQRLIVLTPN